MTKRRPEEALHKAVVQFLRIGVPDDVVFWHTPNQKGTRRTWEQQILKSLGVQPGIPDLLVLYKDKLIGLELKSKTGSLTKNQKHMRDRLVRQGCRWYLCRSLEDVFQALTKEHVPVRANVVAQQRTEAA